MKKITSILLAVIVALMMLITPAITLAEEAPQGQTPSGTPGEPPDGQGGGTQGQPPSGGSPGGANTMSYDYSGSHSATVTADGKEKSSEEKTVTSKEKNKNALLALNSGVLIVTKATVNKTGENENGDECNFYGLNSISLTVGKKSKTYLQGSSLTSDSTGSNAVFATDSGKAFVYDTTIETSKDNSRGLDATYDGTILADKLKITTDGDHSAAVATDRGGGNVSVTNSSLTTNGSGSPLLYSTGDIEVDNVKGTASGSQIAGMEGLNTILINNSSLKSTIEKKTASDPIANGVIIYQSTSGDAEAKTGDTALFQATNSTLQSSIQSGAMFYVTNTNAHILLKDTAVKFDDSKAKLLVVEGNNSNSWGTAGQNGGTLTFTANNETLKGDISVDTISSAEIFLLKGTKYTGKTSIKSNTSGSAVSDNLTMNIGKTSTWTVTGNAKVTNLNVAEGGKIVDEDGNIVSILVNGKTKVKGDSKYKVTVTGKYSTSVSTDHAVKESKEYISRASFDKYFETSTTFGTNKTEKKETSFWDKVKAFFHIK